MADTKLVICEKCWGTGHVNGGNENSTWSKTCEDCRGIGFSRVPMTNADRIRAMSDEELAKLFCGFCKNAKICEGCPMCDGKCAESELAESWVEWLQQPAEGECP